MLDPICKVMLAENEAMKPMMEVLDKVYSAYRNTECAM